MTLPPSIIYSEYPIGIRFNLLMYYDSPNGDYLREVVPYQQEAYKIESIIVERNLTGKSLEKELKVDEAILLYENNIADFSDTPFPYDRLRIIYSKRKQYNDAIRVCQAYIDMCNTLSSAILKELKDKKIAKQLGNKGKFPEYIKKIKELKNK